MFLSHVQQYWISSTFMPALHFFWLLCRWTYSGTCQTQETFLRYGERKIQLCYLISLLYWTTECHTTVQM